MWHLAGLLIGLAIPASSAANPVKRKNGIVDVPSNHSVDQTVDRLKDILQSKGVTLFALIDHSGEAEKVGIKMPSIKLLIFCNARQITSMPPRIGTTLSRPYGAYRPSAPSAQRATMPSTSWASYAVKNCWAVDT